MSPTRDAAVSRDFIDHLDGQEETTNMQPPVSFEVQSSHEENQNQNHEDQPQTDRDNENGDDAGMALATPPQEEEDFDKEVDEAEKCASEEKSLLDNQDASEGEDDG